MQNLSVLKQVGEEKQLPWAQDAITSGFNGELSKWILREVTRTHMTLGIQPSFAGCSDPDSGVDERTGQEGGGLGQCSRMALCSRTSVNPRPGPASISLSAAVESAYPQDARPSVRAVALTSCKSRLF